MTSVERIEYLLIYYIESQAFPSGSDVYWKRIESRRIDIVTYAQAHVHDLLCFDPFLSDNLLLVASDRQKQQSGSPFTIKEGIKATPATNVCRVNGGNKSK